MDYELAKKLKEANYPFNPWYVDEGLTQLLWDNYADVDAEPTLEELIEACGELGVVRVDYAKHAGAVAQGKFNDNTEKFYLTREGETPTEAVANLWLALNTK